MTESALASARICWMTVLIPRGPHWQPLLQVDLGPLAEDVGRRRARSPPAQPDGAVAERRQRRGQAAGGDRQPGQRRLEPAGQEPAGDLTSAHRAEGQHHVRTRLAAVRRVSGMP